jgi:nitrate reductase gamma subunit
VTWGESVLWAVGPYATIVIFVAGLIWRYRYDRFGWTTRSARLYESPLLRAAGPLFHYALLFVIVAHVAGLLVPVAWTGAVALAWSALAGVAGLATLAGLALLIHRRRAAGPVFLAATGNDKIMYAVLAAAIVSGVATTAAGFEPGAPDYRSTVAPWFRSVFVLRPEATAMGHADGLYKVHTLIGMGLFALFPFSRLVHAFSAPLGYLFRPYIVYRRRAR